MPLEPHTSQLAMRPTWLTLYLRRSLLWQFVRFILINLRMMAMISKSHDTRLVGETRARRPPTSTPARP